MAKPYVKHNMVSFFMADVIGIRDDMYIGKGHTYQKEFMDAVTEGNNDGILEQRPTLVNLQCDVDHPTVYVICFTSFMNLAVLRTPKAKSFMSDMGLLPSYGKPPPFRSVISSDDTFRYGRCSASSGRI